jgi:hypothetical protein
MKLSHVSAPLAILAFVYFFSACTKTTNTTRTIYDTTTIVRKDTITKKDTITRVDTLVLHNPKNPVTGLWVGTYTIDGNVAFGTFYFSWAVFPDHTLIERGGGPNGVTWTAQGTWTLAADSTFSADLSSTDPSEHGVTEHETAKYSSVTGKMSNGHLSYTNGLTETHSFTLNRAGDQ